MGGNKRVEAIFTDVTMALRDIIKKHNVTLDEYRAATAWLTEAGNQGYEIPLMMDVFLSVTVDNINSPADGSTESNVEGPFYIPEAPLLERPYVLPRRDQEPGDTLVLAGSIRSTDGSPLAGAMLDVWQCNGIGEYSHFHPGVPEYNLRGRLVTDDRGRYEFETVVPSPYEIPKAGATGKLLTALGRHAFRPAHIHFKLSHAGFWPRTTQIYFEGDPWLDSDVVEAVKPELVIKLERNGNSAMGTKDFVLQPAAGDPSTLTPGGG
jgi:catechol 1,2-dioxygenase